MIRAPRPARLLGVALACLIADAGRAEAPTAACPTRPDQGRIASALEQLEASWVSFDDVGFRKHVDALRYLLPCAGEVLPPPVAARVHRAFALDAWVRGDRDAAREALRAASALDPGWVAPEGWLPDELVLRDVEAAATERVPWPHDGALAWDGTPSRRRPVGAAVLQWVDDGGGVLGSWYLRAEDPLPDYDPAYRSRRNLLGVAAVGLAVGAAAYGAAWATRGDLDRATDLDQVHAVQLRTNALTAGGVGLLGAGAVSFGLAWTVGR